jgi:hypothetical protein
MQTLDALEHDLKELVRLLEPDKASVSARRREGAHRNADRAADSAMRFLITNDDGILAHGIECLAEAAQPLGDVFVVAPTASRARPVIRSRSIIRCGPCSVPIDAGRWTARRPIA